MDKKSCGSNTSGDVATQAHSETLTTQYKSAIMENQELAEELHKPFIRKFEKPKYTHLLKAMLLKSWT